jgi:deoxycytidylate deaminase
MRNVNLPWGLELCRKAFHKKRHRKRVVAAYIEGNTIIIDSNSRKTHPDANRFGHRLNHTHAELAVLRHVNDASRGTLYVYRETQDGELAMARPCEFCQKLLLEKNIRKVVYTTALGFAKEKFFL